MTMTLFPPAQAALKQLQTGNARYVAGASSHPRRDTAHRVDTVKAGQHPSAAVITCSDSRVPVELILHQGIGDVFVIRVAGNVCGPFEIASVEYAVAHLEVPLVVMLGHTHCGAVQAALAAEESAEPAQGYVAALLAEIQPALEQTRRRFGKLPPEAFATEVVRANIYCGIQNLLRKSLALRTAGAQDQVALIGALYDLESGKIEWLGPHPHQQDLLQPPPGNPAV